MLGVIRYVLAFFLFPGKPASHAISASCGVMSPFQGKANQIGEKRRHFGSNNCFSIRISVENSSDRAIVVAGDLNIAHKEIDIWDARTNQKNSGFLPWKEDITWRKAYTARLIASQQAEKMLGRNELHLA